VRAALVSGMLCRVAVWIGVDVGGKRKGFDVAVIDGRRVLALRNHLTCSQVVDIVMAGRPAVVAIDSPRRCAPDGQTARAGELQLARSICGIRWTPDARGVHASAYYAWVLEGLALFDALAAAGVEAIEVFPTASWTRWHGKRGTRTRAAWTRQGLAALGLQGVPARTNQDQRDAIAAAMTARQHSLALTETMGDIVVPAGEEAAGSFVTTTARSDPGWPERR
jgi:predicted nuclease with RNAse H fold